MSQRRNRTTLAGMASPGLIIGVVVLFGARLSAGTWDPPLPLPQPADAASAMSEEGTSAGPAINDPPTPVVSIKLRVQANAVLGEEIEYCICLENHANADAHHVVVRNPLSPHAQFVRAKPEPSSTGPELIWRLGTMAGCTKREIKFVLIPKGTGDIDNCARVQFEHGQCVKTKINKPSLSLRKQGPANVVLYDALTYRLTVTNGGTVEVASVALTDTIPPELEHSSGKRQLTWDLGAIGPGEERVVEYQVVAKASGRYCNKAVATAGSIREEAESCVVVGEPKLTLAKTGPQQRYVNLPATYHITVSNPGTAPLHNVVLTDAVPESTRFISATNNGQLTGPQVQWNLGSIEAGGTRNIEVVLQATQPARVCNRASARADRGLAAQAEVCTNFVGESALLLEVVDIDDPVEVGAETRYVILVRNQGTKPVSNVVISALVPTQFAVARVTGPAGYRQEGQRVIFQPLTLAPQKDAHYAIEVKGLAPGDVRFKVELTADVLTSGPVHEEESTTIYQDTAINRNEPPIIPQRRARSQ